MQRSDIGPPRRPSASSPFPSRGEKGNRAFTPKELRNSYSPNGSRHFSAVAFLSNGVFLPTSFPPAALPTTLEHKYSTNIFTDPLFILIHPSTPPLDERTHCHALARLNGTTSSVIPADNHRLTSRFCSRNPKTTYLRVLCGRWRRRFNSDRISHSQFSQYILQAPFEFDVGLTPSRDIASMVDGPGMGQTGCGPSLAHHNTACLLATCNFGEKKSKVKGVSMGVAWWV